MNGFTKEEKFLNRLSYESFLRFWSWPNLFRDQGDTNKGGEGKEICDLTVIFGNDILLFSDKKVDFHKKKDINIAWSRWAKRAIRDSVKQIEGARRWFQKYPERVFIDKKCNKPLPINLPPTEEIHFHEIVVCHGLEKILMTYNTETSFCFDNTIVEAEHWSGDTIIPFTIGKILEVGHVHVFNESTIELILNEFDTVTDFIAYLKQREWLLNLKKTVKVKSETDIVQLYYENFDTKTRKRSILSAKELKSNHLDIDKGGIAKLFSNPQFLSKKKADKISYFWDDLIESFSFHILNESLSDKNWDLPSDIEPSLRLIAEAGRFERRILSEGFIEFYNKTLPQLRGTRLVINPFYKERAYLYLLVPFTPSFGTHEKYREIRKQMLEDYCLINKFTNRKLELIIGVAAKTRESDIELNDKFFNEGQDIVFFNVSDWNDRDVEYARKTHDEYLSNGLLAKRNARMETIYEFPDLSSDLPVFRKKIIAKGVDRNKPCICGSGKKMKKCCSRS